MISYRNAMLAMLILIVLVSIFAWIIITDREVEEGARRLDVESGAVEQEAKPELILYCGAGIRPAATLIISEFEKQTGVKVNATYAGSGQLLAQITTIQKGDLFMPGAELYVNKAIEKGLLVEDSKRIVAYFVPVILVQKDNPHGISSLADLTKENLRIGFGDERSCAIGRHTLKILKKNNIDYSEVEQNVVYKSATVNELGTAIQLKTIDATIVWDANARHFEKDGTIVPIPMEENIVSVIPIGLLKSSRFPKEARAFIDFAVSETAKRILIGRGYTVSLPE